MENNKIIELLRNIQQKSVANKRKVGAFIYNVDTGKIISEGINYNPCNDGIVENSEADTYDTVIHAEESAIMELFASGYSRNKNKLALYCTFSPCMNCCRLIVQIGISSVYYVDEHKSNFVSSEIKGSNSPLQYLLSQGVFVAKYNQKTEMFENKTQTAVIYHSADIDGLMSGYLMKQAFPESVFIPYNYEKEADWMLQDFSNIIFVDITPPLSWIEANKKRLTNKKLEVMIYDHHLDALQNIEDVKKILKIHDIITIIKPEKTEKLSAAGVIMVKSELLQQYLSNNTNVSELIDIVSDYDCWKFVEYEKEKRTRIFNIITYLSQTIKTLDMFESFMKEFENKEQTLNDLNQFGEILNIVTKQQNILMLKRSKTTCINNQLFVLYEGYPNYLLQEQIVEYYNLKKINSILYVGYQFDLKNQVIKFSTRSRKLTDLICDYVTALNFASKYGGGGHPEASGFTLPFKEGIKLIDYFPKI